ncbi:recombinase family protein [Corynebacterium sp. H128]|uniref:recombinase family protein n=1 Tax=Corynebacterium sp. H128 TaxID=3133427 RepID=UPI003098DD84
MRILARVRLSKSTEESTSVERQRDLIQTWASANDHEIIGWAEDVDVSGSISPFDAPALGPWLREPKQNDWDALVCWKLDRVARNAIELNRLFGWLTDNEKSLVSINESLDFSTWVGRMVASVIAGVAEGELEAIKERISASQRHLRQVGRWRGGHVPFGWTTAPREEGGLKLVHDPISFPVLRRIIEEYIAGKSAARIARDLTAEGIPTPRRHSAGKPGGVWGQDTVRVMLENRQLLGWTMHNGKPVIGDDGKPVLKCPPAVTPEEWDLLQQTLAGRRWEKGSSDRTSPLLGVLECWFCGARMHHKKQRERKTGVYKCADGCKGSSVNDAAIEPLVSELVLAELGGLEILELRHNKVDTSQAELELARSTYEELAKYIPTVESETARSTLFTQLDTVGKRVAELEKLATPKPHSEYIHTGETYAQRWETLDTEARRQLLIVSGIRFRARQLAKVTTGGLPPIESEMIIPHDLKQRLQQQHD